MIIYFSSIVIKVVQRSSNHSNFLHTILTTVNTNNIIQNQIMGFRFFFLKGLILMDTSDNVWVIQYGSYVSYFGEIYLEINSFELVLGRVNNGCGLLCGTIDFVQIEYIFWPLTFWVKSWSKWIRIWSKSDLTPTRVNFRLVQKVDFSIEINFTHFSVIYLFGVKSSLDQIQIHFWCINLVTTEFW